MSDEITIYHNPRCSNSRGALAILEEQGIQHEVVEYLKSPLSEATLRELISMLDGPPSALVRSKEPEYKTSGLSAESTPEAIAKALAAEPRLMQRPVVVRGGRAVIARPPESLLPWFDA